ncbi:MAG: SDR family oxidoreductase [Chitinophagaceae bacterium]
MDNVSEISPVMVVGATGYLGMEICRQLIAAKKRVKGLVRSSSDPGKVDALKKMGVETVIGDMKDLTSLKQAFQNVHAVISTATATLSRQEGDSIESVDQNGQLNVIEAAKAAGSKQLVYISFNEIAGEFPLQTAKRTVEKELKESGLDYTILQPAIFMEVWLSPMLGFDYPNARATLYGEGKSQISWISLNDVAAFAVASLDNSSAKNATIELGGPDAISPLEVVKIFEEQTGNAFELTHVPIEALQAQKESAADPISKSFAYLMISFTEGNIIDMRKTLDSFPLALRSVGDYAKGVVSNKH